MQITEDEVRNRILWALINMNSKFQFILLTFSHLISRQRRSHILTSSPLCTGLLPRLSLWLGSWHSWFPTLDWYGSGIVTHKAKWTRNQLPVILHFLQNLLLAMKYCTLHQKPFYFNQKRIKTVTNSWQRQFAGQETIFLCQSSLNNKSITIMIQYCNFFIHESFLNIDGTL